jgi:hypothetical protein
MLPYAIPTIRKNIRFEGTLALIIFWLVLTISVELIYSSRVLFEPPQQTETRYGSLVSLKILSDVPALTTQGRDPNLLDPFTSHDLELAGRWDSAPIIENVTRGDYDLIILASMVDWRVVNYFRGVSYFSPELVKAVNYHYSVLCTTPNSAVLKPNIREVDVSPADLTIVLGQGHACGPELRGSPPNLRIPPGVR